jgi:hypothetical protein
MLFGAIFIIALITFFGNFMNKMMLITYDVKSTTLINIHSENQYLLLINFIKKTSDLNNADYYFKSTENYIGETLSNKDPSYYKFVNFGFCNYKECVSVSNDFKPNEFQIFYYDNLIVPGEKSSQFTEKFDRFEQILNSGQITK